MKPNREQLEAAVRQTLTAVGAYAAGRGWLPADLAGALVGLAMVGGPFLWSQARARQSHKAKEKAA